jgi:hypothetical protein
MIKEMKKIYLLSVIFCCFLTASGNALTNKSNGLKEKIDLEGDLAANKQRSLIKPIEAFVSLEESIEVKFYANLGTITISIYDETGIVVYQQSVSTSSELQHFIDISSFADGEYTIEFVNSQDKYLQGTFEI